MNSAREIAPHIGIAAACLGLGVARATFYRAQRPVSVPQANVPRASSPRALSVPEQHTILEWLHQPAYADLSPRTVFAMLLDAGSLPRLGVHLLQAFARLGRDPRAAQ